MSESYQHEKIILELLKSSQKDKAKTKSSVPYTDLSKTGREKAWQFFYSQQHPPAIHSEVQVDKTKQAHLEYQREVEAHKIMGIRFTEAPPQVIPKLKGWPRVNVDEEYEEENNREPTDGDPNQGEPSNGQSSEGETS